MGIAIIIVNGGVISTAFTQLKNPESTWAGVANLANQFLYEALITWDEYAMFCYPYRVVMFLFRDGGD